jgi:hypothetical protein
MIDIAPSRAAHKPSRRSGAPKRHRKVLLRHTAKPPAAPIAATLTSEERVVLGRLPCALRELPGAATAIGFRRFETQELLNTLIWAGAARLRIGGDGRIFATRVRP